MIEQQWNRLNRPMSSHFQLHIHKPKSTLDSFLRRMRWATIPVAFFIVSPVLSTPLQSPVAYVQGLYAGQELLVIVQSNSPRIRKLWAQCDARARRHHDICMDISLFVMGQDYQISDLRVTQIAARENAASVRADFKNFKRLTSVTYNLVRGSNGWIIDEMRGCFIDEISHKRECLVLSIALQNPNYSPRC
jgi:hypothetical protein